MIPANGVRNGVISPVSSMIPANGVGNGVISPVSSMIPANGVENGVISPECVDDSVMVNWLGFENRGRPSP